jgi:hypothetical protein
LFVNELLDIPFLFVIAVRSAFNSVQIRSVCDRSSSAIWSFDASAVE